LAGEDAHSTPAGQAGGRDRRGTEPSRAREEAGSRGQPTPTDPASFTFVALDTRTPYTLDFAGADGGKNANYLLR